MKRNRPGFVVDKPKIHINPPNIKNIIKTNVPTPIPNTNDALIDFSVYSAHFVKDIKKEKINNN
jgi:hypothetical protein